MEERQIDLTLFIAEAIANNEKTYSKIDEIFSQNKQYYLEIMKKYSDKINFFNYFTLLQDDYIKKFLSIFYSAVAEGNIKDGENILEIIKLGWRYIYNYVEMNKIIDFDDFYKKYTKKYKNLETDEINSAMLILLFLSLNNFL